MYNIDKKEIIRTFKLFYTGGSSMKKIRNILSLALVFIMLIGLMPMNVFAEPGDTPAPTVTVKSIVIDTSSTYKKEYKVGDSLDVSGLKIKVTKSDNSEETVDVTSGMVTGFNSDTAVESQELTINYEKQTTTYTVKIKAEEPVAKKFKLTAIVDGEGGTIDPSGENEYKENDKVTIKITITEGYELDEVKVNDVDKKAEVANKELKLTMTENKKVVVKFKKTVNEDEKKALEEAKKTALADLEKLTNLTPEEKEAAKKDIEGAKNEDQVKAAIGAAKTKNDAKKPDTPVKTVKVVTIGNGTASVDNEYATKGQTVKVTATPYSGYAVARVYLKYNDITKNINTYYNGYYYDGRYYGRYNDYNKYLYVYENSSYYLRKYDSYREFLRHEYPSHYRYYEDYDYWTDRYDYDWYDRYDNYYYKYFDDFRRSRYDTYEEYLRAEHYTHYRDYYNYRYDYNWYNRYGYTTTDTFEMPASNVTVYVEFTDWTYYGYYYDDYYYYRTRRDRKAEEAKAKAEAAKKEEEEAKAKAEAEKLPQIYENKAVIAIGSNVLDKVSKNVHTVHQMDTPAYVKNGRVMLPLRYVAEALGLQVSWVPETKTVIIWDLTQRVEIPVKSNRIIVNGITYTSDVKPEIKSSRTMLPIANIARALGLVDGSDIYWDQYNKQVTLTRKVLSK